MTRRLLREEITLSVAKDREVNVLHQLGYFDQQCRFFAYLHDRRECMKALVAHHLGLSTAVCHIAEIKDWLRGSFNVCIPVTLKGWNSHHQAGQRVILRFPLPYRVGDKFRPGNGDEKLQCEAGTYAWLQQNCPDIPIPNLYGFALSTGQTFTRTDNLPFLSRCFQYLRQHCRSWFRLPVPSNYALHPNQIDKSILPIENSGYLLIEYIEETRGAMLSNTWPEKQDDCKLRNNFLRDYSRILLSLSRIPIPHIGSFIVDREGFLALHNRPLSMELQQLENENIPTYFPRDSTYSSVESYVVDILGVHDSRLRHQPNAINDIGDCVDQMSALTAMRAISPMFLHKSLSRGPFVFTLTDLHASNIFVDDEWHITCLVDLEWACSRPIQMVEVPYWLTNKAIDRFGIEEYDTVRKEMLSILRTQESEISKDGEKPPLILSEVMEQAWTTGAFWYFLALSSPTGLFHLFYEHIQPLLSKHRSKEVGDVLPFYWEKEVARFVVAKLSDKASYDTELEKAFATTLDSAQC